jgi:hypothetical protein
LAILPKKNEKIEMKKPYILFISLRHREKTSNNTSIPRYTTGTSCCGIQLISTIESFHTSPFETVVQGGMVHSKIAFFSRWKAKVGILHDYYGGAESYSFTYTHLGFIHLLWQLALAPSYFSTVPCSLLQQPASHTLSQYQWKMGRPRCGTGLLGEL